MVAIKVILSVYVALLGGVTAQTPTLRFSNTTSPVTKAPAPASSGCCFAMIDTVSEYFWDMYSTKIFYEVVNLTSITTYVTPYPSVTTLSHIETNVYTTNASFTHTREVGENPAHLYENPGGRPSQTEISLNGSQTVTGGVTVKSPAAFWVYPTFKIIHVPAVTDSRGRVACATATTFPSTHTGFSVSISTVPTGTSTHTFVLIETLYSTLPSSLLEPLTTVAVTEKETYTGFSQSFSEGGPFTSTYSNIPTFTVNPFAASYFGENGTKISASEVSLATPYVFLPTRGSKGATADVHDACTQGAGAENYGYPLQEMIDHAAIEHPEVASCLPGGPLIISATRCEEASPEFESPGGDLTSSTVITVTPTDLPPTPVPVQASPAPTTTHAVQTSINAPVLPPTTEVPVESPSPSTSPEPATTNIGDSVADTPEIQPALDSTALVPETSQAPIADNTSPAVAPTPDTPSPSVVDNSPVALPENQPTNNPAQPANPTPNTGDQEVVTAIASIIGAQPTPDSPGAPDDVSNETIVPVIPGSPAPSGRTTIISGTTKVIIPAPTPNPTAEAVAGLSSLGGTTTLISDTLNVVLGTAGQTTNIPVNTLLPALTGPTTVVDGSTYVAVSGPTTIPVIVGGGEAGPSGNGSAAAPTLPPLQASGASGSMVAGRCAMALAFVGGVAALAI